MTERIPDAVHPVATGLSHGPGSAANHADRAVQLALERAGLARANGVLLFLSHEYADDPAPALRAAARAAGCLQVFGCTGSGLITDEEWVLDSPGAAAMVFGGAFVPGPCDSAMSEPVISLSVPSALTAEWLDQYTPRIGAIPGDPFGQGPFRVWSAGRINDTGVVESVIQGSHGVIGVSQGVRALTAPIEVAEVEKNDLLKLGGHPALNVLVHSLPGQIKQLDRIPLHMLMGGVTFGDPDTAIRDGRYRLNHIISANLSRQSITLSDQLNPGERLFWAIRDGLAAERDMERTLGECGAVLGQEPVFALLFSCMGRGPNFFGNRDRDLELLQSRWPGLPTIGFYGNGELAPMGGENHLYQYSAAIGLFGERHHP